MSVHRVQFFAYTTTDAEREVRFHEQVLGLRCVRRRPVTMRGCSGEELSFAAGDDPAATILVAYCAGPDFPTGRQGSNGPRSANLAVPAGSLGTWESRLYDAHIETSVETVLGTKRLAFTAPSGLPYTLVDSDTAGRSGAADAAVAIAGLHSVTLTMMDVRETHAFLLEVLGAEHVEQEIASGYYRFGADGAGLELLHEPYRAPGTWTYAAGTAHHIGIDAGSAAERQELCERLLDNGYPDVSAPSDGELHTSVWVRTPGGTLVELISAR
ncbi:VOC family protein [Nocardia sp. NPDC050378]|uniref:VOC family protein n=1 Tax=Nocardia sp. NPDC050378 TaxID=3155400 RepID=UPI0033EBD751